MQTPLVENYPFLTFGIRGVPTNVYVGPRSSILNGFSNNAGTPLLSLGRAVPAADPFKCLISKALPLE